MNVSIFFVNSAWHWLFPMFSLNFLGGKLARGYQNVPIWASPKFNHCVCPILVPSATRLKVSCNGGSGDENVFIRSLSPLAAVILFLLFHWNPILKSSLPSCSVTHLHPVTPVLDNMIAYILTTQLGAPGVICRMPNVGQRYIMWNMLCSKNIAAIPCIKYIQLFRERLSNKTVRDNAARYYG